MVHGRLRHWLAVIANTRKKTFSIRHEGTHHEKFVQSSRMSYIPICVRVALATSDVQSILDISATDEIHMEGRNHEGQSFPICFTYLGVVFGLSTICIITVRESGTELQGSLLLR